MSHLPNCRSLFSFICWLSQLSSGYLKLFVNPNSYLLFAQSFFFGVFITWLIVSLIIFNHLPRLRILEIFNSLSSHLVAGLTFLFCLLVSPLFFIYHRFLFVCLFLIASVFGRQFVLIILKSIQHIMLKHTYLYVCLLVWCTIVFIRAWHSAQSRYPVMNKTLSHLLWWY